MCESQSLFRHFPSLLDGASKWQASPLQPFSSLLAFFSAVLFQALDLFCFSFCGSEDTCTAQPHACTPSPTPHSVALQMSAEFIGCGVWRHNLSLLFCPLPFSFLLKPVVVLSPHEAPCHGARFLATSPAPAAALVAGPSQTPISMATETHFSIPAFPL